MKVTIDKGPNAAQNSSMRASRKNFKPSFAQSEGGTKKPASKTYSLQSNPLETPEQAQKRHAKATRDTFIALGLGIAAIVGYFHFSRTS